MNRLVIVGLMMGCATACASDPTPAVVDISVDATAAPGAAFVQTYFATGAPRSTAIATPDILAGAAPAAVTAMTWSGQMLAEARREAVVGFGLRSAGGLEHPLYVAALAFDVDNVLAGAWSGPIEDLENAEIDLALDAALVPELWGTRSETGKCFRLRVGTTTMFITRADDADCDGRLDAQDSQPFAYCDPAAVSGPAHDACL